ncbi:hypothetical protein DV736_g4517, partial [Chaetothyriales sp. CBS 134916]
MFINHFAVLALAGTSIAAPALQERKAWGGPWQAWGQGGWNGHGGALESTSTIWDIATDYVTVTGEAPQATWTAPAETPSATTTESPSAPAEYAWSTAWAWTWTETPSAPAPTTEAPTTTSPTAASPTAQSSESTVWSAWSTPSSSAAPSATGSSYLDIANQWRSAGGLPDFTESSLLQGNALKTAQNSGGQLIHELNPGSLAQVLAPGNADNFESVYVGGWLCEIPSLPGLDGVCTTEAQGWDHSNGDTGHADILTSTSYSQIGCALAEGIWACDLS